MDFEEQLLIGGLLMTIAVLSASHAHARDTPPMATATKGVSVQEYTRQIIQVCQTRRAD